LTVAENIFLFDLPRTRVGFVDYQACRNKAKETLARLDIELDPGIRVERLTFIEKKLVSIAKAASRMAKILILDEPTASLDENGKDILFNVIRKNTKKGLSVIYISHNLGEVFEISDRVTILKDGKKVATHRTQEVGMEEIVREMIGRSTTTIYSKTGDARVDDKRTLKVIDYSREGVVEHVSFSVRKGEIFGLGGLVGSGRTELARMIFGLDEKDSGRLAYCGTDITPKDPYDAIRKGIGYLTEDRKGDGLLLGRPIFENISLVNLAKSNNRLMNLGKEHSEAENISRQLDIKTGSIENLVLTLSGGNQQKVVLAKWLYAGTRILIFDEPTVGIDVGAKGEIYRMMEDLVREGKIVIMISSDNPELISMCDRVGIMRDGRLMTILEGEEINEENILRYSIGVVKEDRRK